MLVDDFDWSWGILNENISVEDFICSKKDRVFENFLKDSAILYQKERLGITYVILIGNKVVAYYTLANDKITMNGSKAIWNKLARKIPNEKRRSGYPALKLCQLAVDDNHVSNGFGKMIVNRVIKFALDSKSGCRFITIDALPEAETFYSRMGFIRLSDSPNTANGTIPMYFDLGKVKE